MAAPIQAYKDMPKLIKPISQIPNPYSTNTNNKRAMTIFIAFCKEFEMIKYISSVLFLSALLVGCGGDDDDDKKPNTS